MLKYTAGSGRWQEPLTRSDGSAIRSRAATSVARRTWHGALAVGASLIMAFGAGSALAAGPGIIRGATAITQVYGEGQKLSAVALEYNRPVKGARLSPSTYRVDGRTIVRVFASRSADPSHASPTGRFVIIELSPTDTAAALKPSMHSPAGGQGGGGRPAGGGGPPALGSRPADGGTHYLPAAAHVVQVRPIAAAGGGIIRAGGEVSTTAVKNIGVDDFQQFTFKDPETGYTLKYNLFVPKNYSRTKRYPMVLFMHDASATGDDPKLTLRQGLGAISFASPVDQAKHPAFVLAPQFAEVVADDNSRTTNAREAVANLIHKLEREYAIDPSRLYATGQSGGAMMTIALNIKYPDLFAASFIVAGQWDPALVKPLAHDNLWILVSQGDDKAYPGENAITKVLEGEGAHVSRAVWDGTWTGARFARAVAAMEARHTPVNYVALREGTVVPPGQPNTGGMNHVNTWRIAYTIGGIRDWLFKHRR